MTIDTSTEAVDALLKDVTPGPWDNQGHHRVDTEFGVFGDASRSVCSTGGFQDGNEGTHHENKSNARFIAASRQLVPALLAERDQLRDELDAAYAIIAAERAEVIKLRDALSKKDQANDC